MAKEESLKRQLKKADGAASYCCEAAANVDVADLPQEMAFAKEATLKRQLQKDDGAASYCCEAAGNISVASLPKELPFTAR